MPRVSLDDSIYWMQVGPGHLRGLMTLNGKEYACDVSHPTNNRLAVAQGQHLIAERFRVLIQEKAATLTVRDITPEPEKKAPKKKTTKKKVVPDGD